MAIRNIDQPGNELDEAYDNSKVKTTPLWQAALPVLFLLALIIYGLMIRPQRDQPELPLEIIFILAASFTIAQLLLMGYSWSGIQDSIVAKMSRAMPAFFILFCIGLIIASWMVCGTIPMLVFVGLKIIDPTYLYVLAFLTPVVFSTLTGTSFGSVGTIGVVLIGIAGALDAHLGITAGAIIGGAYFGDKMSPLSDNTNMAALGADVDLFDHIHSMMYTTLPAAIIASLIYLCMGFVYPPAGGGSQAATLEPFLTALDDIFHFSWLLLLPPAIVLYGSIKKLPTVPILIASVIVASGLAIGLQKFTSTDVIQSVYKGFDSNMITWTSDLPPEVPVLLNRGGLYALNDPIIIAFMVFIFIGAMDHIRAMPTVVNAFLKLVRTRRGTIMASLLATGISNALTCNQYATSFIVGDAFKDKYNQLGIPRKVLSRSLEDTGTMIESIIPWHTSSIYMVATLGVAYGTYWHWQLLSLISIPIAFILAATGIGCFYSAEDKPPHDSTHTPEQR